MSRLYKSSLPSPPHFLFSVFQVCEKAEEAGNRKLNLFPSLSPKCRGGVQPCKTRLLLHEAASGLSGKPMIRLRYLLGPAILQSCIRHRDAIQKVFGFH